jgi:phosphohistidine swiveling domain-containing protein
MSRAQAVESAAVICLRLMRFVIVAVEKKANTIVDGDTLGLAQLWK